MTVAFLRLTAAWVVAVTVLGVVGALVPIESGPFALVGILWVHLALVAVVLVAVVLVPVAVLRRDSRPLRVGLVALAVVGLVRLGPEWLSLSAAAASRADEATLRIVTWNVEIGNDPALVVEALLDHDADVVALQELTPEVAAAIEADAELVARWPERALDARPGVAGIGLLSRLPLRAGPSTTGPVVQLATVDAGDVEIELVHAHPFPAAIARGPFGAPVGFEPARRNEELAAIRRLADDRIAAGSRVVVVGDFNTAPNEPAFGRLTAGLADAHAEVGLGPGWTYRPNVFERLGIGLIRIDLVLGGPGVRPIAIGEDCGRPGDHCLVEATLAITRPGVTPAGAR